MEQAPGKVWWGRVVGRGLDSVHQPALLRQTKRQDRSVVSADYQLKYIYY